METCLLCLELNLESVDVIKVNSTQWQEQNIQNLIEKHFWPMQTIEQTSWLCATCWQELNDFHKFYMRIEDAHTNFGLFSKIENPLLLNTQYEPEISFQENEATEFIKQEAVDNIKEEHDIDIGEDDDDETTLLNTNKRKRTECIDGNVTPTKTLKSSNKLRAPATTDSDDSDNSFIAKANTNIGLNVNLNKDKFLADNFKLECVICQKPMETFQLLTKHFEMEHNGEPGYVICCNTKFLERRLILDHVHQHLDPNYLKCKDCLRVFTNRRYLTKHRTKVHPATDNKQSTKELTQTNDSDSDHPDDKNTSSNKTKSNRRKNINMEKDKFLAENFKLECILCQIPMKNFQILCAHFEKKHPGQPGYVMCCETKFFERRHILDHVHQHLDPNYLKCKVCDKVFRNRRYLNLHNSTHDAPTDKQSLLEQPPTTDDDHNISKTNLGKNINLDKDVFLSENFKLECTLCEKPMENFQLLCSHFEEHHDGEPGYAVCCNIKFFERRLLLDHVHQHLDPNYLKCKICDKVFTNRRYLTVHLKRHEKPTTKLLSKKPSETSDSDNIPDIVNPSTSTVKAAKTKKSTQNVNLEKDKFLSDNFNVQCVLCQLPMDNFQELCAHFEKQHNGEPGYVVCCDTKFFERRLILDHVHQHLDPDYLKCKECGKLFTNRRYLTIHKRKHDPTQNRNYCCDICGLSYTTPHSLICHKQTKHISDEEKMFPCTFCSKRFGTKWLHQEHVKAVHTSAVNCDICGLRLVNNYALRKHKYNKHSEGENITYTCSICSKVHTNKYAHRNHISTVHRTGYNHKCTVCDRAFKRRRSLQEHVAIHTGKPLYTCPWCPKTFNSNSNIASHRRRRHPQEEEDRIQNSEKGNVKIGD